MAAAIPESVASPAEAEAGRGELVAEGVHRVPEFEAMFAPETTGYLGADGVFSLDLGGGRYFWLFGDTLVGEVVDGRRAMRAMPRNSIAIQYAACGEAGRIERFWGEHDGAPDDFLRLRPHGSDFWFWPGTGLMLNGQMVLLGYAVEPARRDCEALSFHVTGMWCVRVKNPAAPPPQWEYTVQPVNVAPPRAFFCTACHVEGDYVYLMGPQWRPVDDEDGEERRSAMCLARVRLDELANGRVALEYWTKLSDAAIWSRSGNALVTLFRPGVTEASIVRDAPRDRLLATTYNPRDGELFLATAPHILGPWSEPQPLFVAPEHGPARRRMSYAGRLHSHLARHADEAIMSYIVNGRHMDDTLGDLNIYYPRFVSLDLKRI